MEENFHIYIVVMIHIGFAAAIRLWKGNERFSRLFAATWLIEAVRAAILLPEVHSIGGMWNEWFGLAEVLSFIATGFLILSGAALMGHQIPKKLMILYFAISIPTILTSRYFGPSIIASSFGVTMDEAQFWRVELNLILMFAPAMVLRMVFAWWLYRTWKETALVGAFIAFVFAIVYSLVTIAAPIQYYYSLEQGWTRYFWCLHIFGFSMGMLMLMIGRSEQQVRQSVEQLSEALNQLETAQQRAIGQARLKALGQMSAGVAHDVNNSLTPLMTYANLLESQADLEHESRDLARLIQLSANDMAQTVKRLDHFYRESHDREYLEPLDLAELVEQTVRMTKPKWQDQARTNGKQITTFTKIESRPQIRGDASPLRSVLTNLIFNACDAIEDNGTIQLRIESNDKNAIVSITDNGSGMTQEQLDHCLEPFYTCKEQGVGLGLSECHGIIRQHGGEISIDSALGKQTTVRFTLPIDEQAQTSKEVAEPEGITSNNNRPRILCIDDDERVLKAMTMLLHSLPAEPRGVGDGKSAIELLKRESFDLVLCDQGLPGMDGLSVMRAIKSSWPELPVVMVSGWTLPKITDGPRPDGFIAKPFGIDTLSSTVREHVRRSRAEIAG